MTRINHGSKKETQTQPGFILTGTQVPQVKQQNAQFLIPLQNETLKLMAKMYIIFSYNLSVPSKTVMKNETIF